jgi:hypothetical protein
MCKIARITACRLRSKKRSYGVKWRVLPGLRVGSASEGGSLRKQPFLPEPWVLEVKLFSGHARARSFDRKYSCRFARPAFQ